MQNVTFKVHQSFDRKGLPTSGVLPAVLPASGIFRSLLVSTVTSTRVYPKVSGLAAWSENYNGTVLCH